MKLIKILLIGVPILLLSFNYHLTQAQSTEGIQKKIIEYQIKDNVRSTLKANQQLMKAISTQNGNLDKDYLCAAYDHIEFLLEMDSLAAAKTLIQELNATVASKSDYPPIVKIHQLMAQAEIESYNEHYLEAEKLYESALEQSRKVSEDTLLLRTSINLEIAALNNTIGDYPRALQGSLAALRILWPQVQKDKSNSQTKDPRFKIQQYQHLYLRAAVEFAKANTFYGNYRTADSLFTATLTTVNKWATKKHPDHLAFSLEYGKFLAEKLDFKAASKVLKSVESGMQIYYKTGHYNHIDALIAVAKLDARRERNTTAANEFSKAIWIMEKGSYPKPAFRIKAYVDRANFLLDKIRNRDIDVEKMFTQANKVLGETTVDLPITRIYLRNAQSKYQQKIASGKTKLVDEYLQSLAQVRQAAGERTVLYADLEAEIARLMMLDRRFPISDSLYRHALAQYEVLRHPNQPDYIEMLGNFAQLLVLESKYEEADKILARVYAETKKFWGDEHINTIMAMDKAGKAYVDMGKLSKADSMLTNAFKLIQPKIYDYSFEYSLVLEHIGELYQAQGKYKDAEVKFLEVERLKTKYFSQEQAAYSSSGEKLAELYAQMGQYEKAIEYLLQIIKNQEKSGIFNDSYANAQYILARIYLDIGKYSQAEQAILKSRNLNAKIWGETHLKYGVSLLTLAEIEIALGRYENAEKDLLAAVAIHNQYLGAKNLASANVLATLATLYHLQGKAEKAIETMNNAVNNAKAAVGEKHIGYAKLLTQMANLLIANGKLTEAAAALNNSLQIQEEVIGAKHPDYIRTVVTLATLYKEQKNYKEAQKHYNSAVRNWEKIMGKSHPDYPYFLFELAELYWLEDKISDAKDSYLRSINLILKNIDTYFPAMSEEEKTKFWNKTRPKLEIFNYFAAKYAQQEPDLISSMYNYQIKTKALLLNTSTKARNRILNSKDEALIKLYQKWIEKREYLAKLYAMPTFELEASDINLTKEEQEVNDLEKELSAKSEEFASSKDSKNYTWKDIQGLLKEKEAVVELIRTREFNRQLTDSVFYIALIISPTTNRQPEMVILPNGKNLEKRYFLNYTRSLSNRFEDTLSYDQYWRAIDQKLGNATRIYVSNDGVYNQISLASLRISPNNYLIDKRDIFYISNSKDLVQLRDRKTKFKPEKTAVLAGNPDFDMGLTNKQSYRLPALPETQTEIENIGTTLKKYNIEPTLFEKESVTEANIKNVSNTGILHIATHGFFYPDVSDYTDTRLFGIQIGKAAQNPLLRSGLFLAGSSKAFLSDLENADGKQAETDSLAGGIQASNTNNGVLTAYEMMNMSLDKTELVVLSACETGLGKVKNGEGVYGLQRALSIAGAHSVIMSLWHVDDAATQELMSTFYNKWLENKAAPDAKFNAFKAAQQQLKTKYQSPYYWGAFILIGQ